MNHPRLRTITSAALALTAGVAAPALIANTATAVSAPDAETASSCAATNFESTGDITGTVDDFRAALGDLNAFEPVANEDGRRQINWDAAPAAISDPNPFPGDFFNFNASPRARGIEFTTPGTGFLLSGDLDDGTPIEFESINPTFEETFATFSPERLFTPLGSNVVEVTFFSPIDQTTPATVDGFGAVFTDVDLPGSAAIEYFDVDGQLLHTVTAVGSEGQETLEFLGATFDDTCVATVKITAGEVPLAFDVADVSFDNTLVAAKVGNIADLVVMDDFIFGEPFVELCLGQIPTIVADGSGPVVGTDGDDVILGTDSRDVIDGRGGNDVICGERGDDTIRGGAGDDTIDGGANNDTVFGGGGDDTITDPSGTNRLNGQGGNDSISGGGADDTINGGGGRDVLRGFAGNDRINGGAGADQVAGGAGVDFCSFDGNDVTVHCEAELAG